MFKHLLDLPVEQGGDCCRCGRSNGGGAMVATGRMGWLDGRLDGWSGDWRLERMPMEADRGSSWSI